MCTFSPVVPLENILNKKGLEYQIHSRAMKIPNLFVQTFFLISDWLSKLLIIQLSNERVFKTVPKLHSEGGKLQ